MYVVGDKHNISKHVNSIPANVGIDFLEFVLKSCSRKGQYSMMLKKTIHVLWAWFCPNRAMGSCEEQCAAREGLGSFLKL